MCNNIHARTKINFNLFFFLFVRILQYGGGQPEICGRLSRYRAKNLTSVDPCVIDRGEIGTFKHSMHH